MFVNRLILTNEGLKPGQCLLKVLVVATQSFCYFNEKTFIFPTILLRLLAQKGKKVI